MNRASLALTLGLLATLGVGFALKSSCFFGDFNRLAYRGLCYSDIPPLYGARYMDEDAFPYVDHGDDGPLDERRGFVEYPVVTGFFLWAMALVGTAREAVLPIGAETYWEYFNWTALFLGLLALGTLLLLRRDATDQRRLLMYAVAPSLALYAFHNWDLLALFFGTLAFFLYRRGHLVGAGIATGLGAASKLYPLLLAPAMFFDLVARCETGTGWRRLFDPRALRFAAALVATLVLLHLPFLLLGPEMVVETYRYHARRLPNTETPWFVLHYWARRWDWATGLHRTFRWLLPIVSGLVLTGMAALLAWRIDRRRIAPLAAGFALVLVFMLTNKIYSVQYALWVLPFLPLLAIPWRTYAFFAAADVAVYATIFPALGILDEIGTAASYESDAFAASFAWVTIAVLMRHASLAWLLVHALRPTRLSPAPVSGAP